MQWNTHGFFFTELPALPAPFGRWAFVHDSRRPSHLPRLRWGVFTIASLHALMLRSLRKAQPAENPTVRPEACSACQTALANVV